MQGVLLSYSTFLLVVFASRVAVLIHYLAFNLNTLNYDVLARPSEDEVVPPECYEKAFSHAQCDSGGLLRKQVAGMFFEALAPYHHHVL